MIHLLRLALGSDFGRAAADAVLDLTGDDDQELRKQRSLMKWDRKKKKFIGQVSYCSIFIVNWLLTFECFAHRRTSRSGKFLQNRVFGFPLLTKLTATRDGRASLRSIKTKGPATILVMMKRVSIVKHHRVLTAVIRDVAFLWE